VIKADPLRGEVWQVNLSPTIGHEQAGTRPALVVSVDAFNRGPADLAVVLPITSVKKQISFHVPLSPPEGGVTKVSFVKCEDLRSVSKERFARRLGHVSAQTMEAVEDRIVILLDLHP
jgi:mRNA interferase MazF